MDVHTNTRARSFRGAWRPSRARAHTHTHAHTSPAAEHLSACHVNQMSSISSSGSGERTNSCLLKTRLKSRVIPCRPGPSSPAGCRCRCRRCRHGTLYRPHANPQWAATAVALLVVTAVTPAVAAVQCTSVAVHHHHHYLLRCK